MCVAPTKSSHFCLSQWWKDSLWWDVSLNFSLALWLLLLFCPDLWKENQKLSLYVAGCISFFLSFNESLYVPSVEGKKSLCGFSQALHALCPRLRERERGACWCNNRLYQPSAIDKNWVLFTGTISQSVSQSVTHVYTFKAKKNSTFQLWLSQAWTMAWATCARAFTCWSFMAYEKAIMPKVLLAGIGSRPRPSPYSIAFVGISQPFLIRK